MGGAPRLLLQTITKQLHAGRSSVSTLQHEAPSRQAGECARGDGSCMICLEEVAPDDQVRARCAESARRWALIVIDKPQRYGIFYM